MAFPFGGHPPLSRFLEWARENGCTAEIKLRTHAISGRPYRSLEMTGPKGGRVVLVDPDLDEHLAPSMVSYLQRRLGVKSPFPAAPELAGAVSFKLLIRCGESDPIVRLDWHRAGIRSEIPVR